MGQAAHRSGLTLVAAVAFYGMATFEGPVMSIKSSIHVHYTDWTIGHVHSGTLGWVGFVSFGAIYCLVPWFGIGRFIRCGSSTGTSGSRPSASWSTSLRCGLPGILQGLMWRAYTSLGFLEYSFIETVEAMHPFYVIRADRRRAVPDRRSDHGVQRLADDLSTGTCSCPALTMAPAE